MIFRKSVLDSIKTPEQLDNQIKIIKPHIWILTISFVIIFITVGIWSIDGNIAITTNMEAIVFPQLGVSTISSTTSGVVKDVLFKNGDKIENGEIIAIISDTETLSEIEQIQDDLKNTKNKKQILNLKKRIKELRDEYLQNSVIRSETSGTIQNIVSVNETVAVGSEIVSILISNESSNNRQLIGYVPLVVANKLQVGMEAQACPSYVSREEYGYMTGYISYIGTMPVTNDDLKKYFGNLEYVSDILPSSSCVEIRITMNLDENSKNLFKWSSKKGNNINVDIGTICNIQVVIENKRPINLVF